MFSRRSLRLPITLAILMIALLIALIIGWLVVTIVGWQDDAQRTAMWVTLLSVGTASLILVLVGTVLYLWLSVKAINLTRRQSNFIDSVTHELKSPIASLKLYLQTLSRRTVDDEQRDSFYKFMLEDVERLDDLINDILEAARLEKETQQESKQVVDLAEILSQTAASVCLRHRVSTDILTLELQPCWIAATRVDMELIFRNLIDNAVKYAGESPEVQVSLENLPAGRARITIRDNGIGVPKKLRRKIFARFVRLGSELQRKKPGTGLGLFIVRTLVARLKGRIEVLDIGDQPGTAFVVELPATQAVPPSDTEADNTVRTQGPAEVEAVE